MYMCHYGQPLLVSYRCSRTPHTVPLFYSSPAKLETLCHLKKGKFDLNESTYNQYTKKTVYQFLHQEEISPVSRNSLVEVSFFIHSPAVWSCQYLRDIKFFLSAIHYKHSAAFKNYIHLQSHHAESCLKWTPWALQLDVNEFLPA